MVLIITEMSENIEGIAKVGVDLPGDSITPRPSDVLKVEETIQENAQENDVTMIEIGDCCSTNKSTLKCQSTVDNTINAGAQETEIVSEDAPVTEVYNFERGTALELSRSVWSSSLQKQQYVRGCLWSPDGTCLLTAVNCDGMHVFELPSDLYNNEPVGVERIPDELKPAVHVKEGGTVYDYCWYPHMNSGLPETCCWIATRQHEPIHMWDAFNGELRCSYKGYDAVDEVEPAIAVAFSIDGEKVIGGYKKNIKVFNTDVPGRYYTEIITKQPISCFAIDESFKDTVAAGSWNCSINLYDLRIPKLGSIATFTEHTGGITFLKFARNGEVLFSGARKDNNLFEWDMRNFSKPIRALIRNVNTNQRIYFDVSFGDRFLVSGDTAGDVHVWKTEENYKEMLFKLHYDCCNGVGFHQAYPILATTSGQYHFVTDDETNQEIVKKYENSLILWWFGDMRLENR